MKAILLAMGRSTNASFRKAMDEYTGRLTHYLPFEVEEVPEPRDTRSLSAQQQKEAEGRLLLQKMEAGDNVVLLDDKGQEYTSKEFAGLMQRSMSQGAKRLVFVVGGPYGFSEQVYRRANSLLSLSKMTFSHQMVRLIFTEQLYRAMTILRGEPYHHE